MKKNKFLVGGLVLWGIVLCLLIGKIIYDDVKRVNNPATVNKSIEFNAVVGGEEDLSKEESKEKEVDTTSKPQKEKKKDKENLDLKVTVKESTKKENNFRQIEEDSLKEKVLIKEIYGTKIYDEVTYEIKNGVKTKKSSSLVVDASNYHASLNDLSNEAKALMIENQKVLKEVLAYTNQYRQEVNVSNLVLDDDLTMVATVRALEMAYTNNFSHTRIDGTNCTDLAKKLNVSFSKMGENIAYGYKTSTSVTKGWRNSKGHYQNMINPEFQKIGIGLFNFNNNIYWVEVFS